MLDQKITFTYGELISAFEKWVDIVNSGKIPPRPNGETIGVMATNQIIELVNKARSELLTNYNK